jgi:hypothetical protein
MALADRHAADGGAGGVGHGRELEFCCFVIHAVASRVRSCAAAVDV